MKGCRSIVALVVLMVCVSCRSSGNTGDVVGILEHRREVKPEAGETCFKRLHLLTYDGDNGEAYFNPAGDMLTYQATRAEFTADQIFTIPIIGGVPELISTGKGRTTCSYFIDADRVVFASTHHKGDAPPPPPDRSLGYVWKMHPEFDLFLRDRKTGALEQLTDAPGYDAEATVAPDGKRIVFTSMRDGNPELYVLDLATKETRRITRSLEYDGGAFFSWDSKMLVYRASIHETAESMRGYLEDLSQNLIRPGVYEIFVCDADGGGKRQVTNLHATSFAPAWHPSNRKIVFMSNVHAPRSHNFDLYMINIDGTGLERVTFHESFDGFPMFSPDGRHLVFCSNRASKDARQTHVFLAEWKE